MNVASSIDLLAGENTQVFLESRTGELKVKDKKFP